MVAQPTVFDFPWGWIFDHMALILGLIAAGTLLWFVGVVLVALLERRRDGKRQT